MVFIKEESEDMKIEETLKHEDTEEQIKMEFIKEEHEDMGIEEAFGVKHEDTEEQTGGFLVESVLKISDFHQTKRYLVTSEELQRRCSPPESYSANSVVAYLRKAKGQKNKISERLAELDVTPSKRTKLTSQCSKLCEDECSDLAGDVMHLAAKFIPQKRVAQDLLEEGDVHAALARTEDCRHWILQRRKNYNSGIDAN
ncbi:uncharacterized protein [Garra rufa]|uniref:uncharacterized protein isoform X2 n=1 Tax=Garra rufa TaxID=137080 RepID=UPI003CCE74CE